MWNNNSYSSTKVSIGSMIHYYRYFCLWMAVLSTTQIYESHGFQCHSSMMFPRSIVPVPVHMKTQPEDDNHSLLDRRSILTTLSSSTLLSWSVLSSLPQQAWAGIDVSGLPVEGGRGNDSGGNPNLVNQLKAYDGSASTRVREVQQVMKETSTSTSLPSSSTTTTTTTTTRSTNTNTVQGNTNQAPIATWAYRANPGFTPNLTRVGVLGNLFRYTDMVQAPTGSKRKAIGIQFEFPADWLQLDRSIGGIQYVDQRNGDKLYVFRVPLPEGMTLQTISKTIMGDAIFDPQGSLAKSGQTIEEYKVTRATTLSECPNQMCSTRRRFQIKYVTVTGNGLRVERRALVDAYQVDDTDIYMLMTSSNAVKFEQKDSLERETVEKIVASFQLDV